MAAKCLDMNWLHFLNLLFISVAYGVDIQLYRSQYFTGLMWQSNSTESCVNIPDSELAFVNSIKTDTCIITYNLENCRFADSHKYTPGETKLPSDKIWIKSYHLCNDEEGGNQLDIDITTFRAYYYYHVVVLQRYKNVCSCVNIPKFVENYARPWSIDSHHNAMIVYYEPDCSENKWNSQFIEGKHWADSNDMWARPTSAKEGKERTNKIQSFGPDMNSIYFQMSCKASYVTTENWNGYSTDNFESSTIPTNGAKNNCGCNLLSGLVLYKITSLLYTLSTHVIIYLSPKIIEF